MKQFLKKTIVAVGGAEYLRVRNRVPRLLFWHGVDNLVDPSVEAESFRIENFKKQIEYLNTKYEIISLDDFYRRYVENNFNGKEVALTFDDGYRNNLTNVAPILKELNLPFTVFISTNNIYSGDLFPTSIVRLICLGADLNYLRIPTLNYEKDISTLEKKVDVEKFVSRTIKTVPFPQVVSICQDLVDNISSSEFEFLKSKFSSILPMNWDEVRALQEFNCTIGSHCMDHICCHSAQDENELKSQIFMSKEIIEKETNRACKYFAYPNGDFTNLTNRFVQEAGYQMGFSTKKTKIHVENGSLFAIPRLGAPQLIEDFKIFINRYPR